MTSSDAQNLVVRMGDHNLDDSSDAVVVEKSVKLIVKNKQFSMQTLVKIMLLGGQGGPHSTMDSVLSSHPAAPGLNLGSGVFKVAEFF